MQTLVVLSDSVGPDHMTIAGGNYFWGHSKAGDVCLRMTFLDLSVNRERFSFWNAVLKEKHIHVDRLHLWMFLSSLYHSLDFHLKSLTK